MLHTRDGHLVEGSSGLGIRDLIKAKSFTGNCWKHKGTGSARTGPIPMR